MSERYEPTSHEYLYEIDREQLFSMFVGAVASLRVDADGVHCLSAEAQAVSRMARAVQERTVGGTPRELELGGLATVTRVLLSRTDGRDKGEDQSFYEPISDLVRYFVKLRAELGDMLAAPGTWKCPVAVPDDLSGVEAISALRADDDGRLWGQLDADDEVLSYDHPDVQAMAENDPALAQAIAEEKANPWRDGPGLAGEPPESLGQ